MHCAAMNQTFNSIHYVCEVMVQIAGERGEMTNSWKLKPLGLNTIVVAEREHYWK